MLDKYYRTMQGFAVLVEKDWLAPGHKFARRTGIRHHVFAYVVPLLAAWAPMGCDLLR